MRKLFLTAFLGMALGSAYAEVVVKTPPPKAVVERRSERPSADHVWVAGYHRWDGHAYTWIPGQWKAPPRPHAVWVAPKWEHHNGGYVMVEGRWK